MIRNGEGKSEVDSFIKLLVSRAFVKELIDSAPIDKTVDCKKCFLFIIK